MSLRARLLVGMSVVGVVLVVAALVITRSTESYLIQRVDAQLGAAQQTVQGGAFDRGGRPPGGSGAPGEHPGNENTSLYVGVVANNQVVFNTTPFYAGADTPPPAVEVDQVVDSAGNPTKEPFTVGTDPPSDTRYRVLASRGRGGQTYVAALSLADVDASVSRLIWVEVIITGLVLGLLGLVTWWVIRLGVRPVKQMTATATAIAAGDLSHRVPVGHEGTEAGELGNALNMMLTRIEEAFDERSASEARLRQFIADASHELRTPVATIRGYAELYRRGGLEEREALRQAMRRTEAETLRMGSLIDDLLLLARLDQGRPLGQAPVDLGVLAVDAAADARARAPERRVTASVSEGVLVNGDEHRLRQLVANLVGNALVHTPPTAPIEARVRTDNGSAVLEVHDDGPGMSPDVAARAFERFYRADPSRSRHHGGSGLGLAIVRAIVDAHGGTVTLDTSLGKGTTVRVELPRLDVSTF
jgi:two-component system OmpR family sensor kinase